VSKEENLCLRWRQCGRSRVSAGEGLAALHATAVTALLVAILMCPLADAQLIGPAVSR